MNSTTRRSWDNQRRNWAFDKHRTSTAESTESIKGLLEPDKVLTSAGWRSLFTFTTRRHVAFLLFAILIGFASGLIDPITTIFLGRVFQAFTDFGGKTIEPSELQAKVKVNCLILIGLGTADWLVNAIFMFVWILFGELQANAARTEIFDRLLVMPAAFFDTRTGGVAAMAPRLQTRVRELQSATAQPLGYMFSTLANATMSLIIALKYEWSLTLILLATMPTNAAVLSFISSQMRNNVQNQIEQLGMASKNVANAITAIETVKCFNGQDYEFCKYASAINRAAGHYLRQVRGNALQIGYVKCMTLLTFMAGFWYGSHLVISGQRTTADIITTFFSCLEVCSSIQNVLPQILVLEKGRVSGAVLRGHLGTTGQISHLGDRERPWSCIGEITIKNVSFAYPARPELQILKDVTCFFPAGKLTFVIGRSGSGKSTLAQLLLKFYEPESGQLLLDGNLLGDLDSHWLRSNITLVEQQSVLFEGTIYDNIALVGKDTDSACVEKVKEAADFALLLSTIDQLQDGFETRVGMKGHSLSGGQRQRLALARARLRNTPVLILDESTSALDSISRSLIVSAIRQWRQNKTTIFISHEISLIEPNDHVCLFNDGYMVQSGPRWKLDSSVAYAIYREQRPKQDAYYAETSAKKPQSPSPEFFQKSQLRPVSDPRQRPILQNAMDESSDAYPGSVLPPPSPVLEADPFIREGGVEPAQAESSKKFSSTSQSEIANIELRALESAADSAFHSQIRVNRERCNPSNGIETTSSEIEHLQAADPMKLKQDKIPSTWMILGTVWRTLKGRQRGILVGAIISTLIHAASIPLFSWVFSRLVTTFYMGERASKEALKWSLSMLGLSFADGGACFGMHVLFESSAQAWVDYMRKLALRRVLAQPREFFSEESNSPSKLTHILDRNAEEMRNILGRFFAFGSVAAVMMVTAVIWCLIVCWKLTLVGLAVSPIAWGITRAYQLISEHLEGKTNDAGEAASAVLNEALTNIKTIQGLTLETVFHRKHSKAATLALKIGIKRGLYSGIFYGLSEAIMEFNNSLIFFYGAILASRGTASVREILLVFAQLLFALGNVTAIVAIIPQVSSSKDNAMRLMKLASLHENSHERHGKIRPLQIGNIVIRNLDFSYPNRSDEAVLQGVNFALRRGTVTALVGSSGSGKSTIANILLRMYPLRKQKRGTPMISIDGRDISRISITKLRELIAMVPQTPVLFPGTVRENIAYGLGFGSVTKDIHSIRLAAVSSGIDDFIISLPNGYETLIGDGGLELSGGQAQRLAIARALVRKPAVLILDEATSALDIGNAALIRETVRNLIRENGSMIVLIITHSKEMMRLADRLVVLEQGRIVDEGSYDELIHRQGKVSTNRNGNQAA